MSVFLNLDVASVKDTSNHKITLPEIAFFFQSILTLTELWHHGFDFFDFWLNRRVVGGDGLANS